MAREAAGKGGKYKIIIIDDDRSFLTLITQEAKAVGRDRNLEIITGSSGEEALLLVKEHAPDAVITDVNMPGMSGVDLFKKLNDRYPNLPIILLTAYGTVDKAVDSIKMGAYHYFKKPINDLNLFWKTATEAASKKKTSEELDVLRNEFERTAPEDQLVGESPPWLKVVEQVRQVAPLPSSVLITGETGAGKEVVARAVHRMSNRADRPFIAVSCPEISASLIESELFGHEPGAFTGANSRRRGLFERAHGGTIFLDEISEISIDMQAKLLRVIQGRRFRRVGGDEWIDSDFRLITATNRDLEQAVAQEKFRADLYYRLAVYPIHLPSLRERPEDIPILAMHFLGKTALKLRQRKKNLSAAALVQLMNHHWPGNVRELENLIERAVIISSSDEIKPKDLPLRISPEFEDSTGVKLGEMERLTIITALERSGFNKSHAADTLGIARSTLITKMKRYGIKTED